MGFEPMTSCLGSKHSTTELHPRKLKLNFRLAGQFSGQKMTRQALPLTILTLFYGINITPGASDSQDTFARVEIEQNGLLCSLLDAVGE
jgi:hypothetical protein